MSPPPSFTPAKLSHSTQNLPIFEQRYLHSLLYLKSALSNESVSSIITPESIRSVFSHILDQGRLGKERLFSGAPDRQSHGSQPKAKSGTSFLWCWFKERYVGVAHGIAGILIQVIQAVQYFEKASKHTMTPLRILLGPHLDLDEIKREIRVCIEFLICELRLANGNYAIRVDETLWNSPQMYPADERVQLSHGAAGRFQSMDRASHDSIGKEILTPYFYKASAFYCARHTSYWKKIDT